MTDNRRAAAQRMLKGYSVGGTVAKAVHKHEAAMHPGKEPTKLATGGVVPGAMAPRNLGKPSRGAAPVNVTVVAGGPSRPPMPPMPVMPPPMARPRNIVPPGAPTGMQPPAPPAGAGGLESLLKQATAPQAEEPVMKRGGRVRQAFADGGKVRSLSMDDAKLGDAKNRLREDYQDKIDGGEQHLLNGKATIGKQKARHDDAGMVIRNLRAKRASGAMTDEDASDMINGAVDAADAGKFRPNWRNFPDKVAKKADGGAVSPAPKRRTMRATEIADAENRILNNPVDVRQGKERPYLRQKDVDLARDAIKARTVLGEYDQAGADRADMAALDTRAAGRGRDPDVFDRNLPGTKAESAEMSMKKTKIRDAENRILNNPADARGGAESPDRHQDDVMLAREAIAERKASGQYDEGTAQRADDAAVDAWLPDTMRGSFDRGLSGPKGKPVTPSPKPGVTYDRDDASANVKLRPEDVAGTQQPGIASYNAGLRVPDEEASELKLTRKMGGRIKAAC